VNNFQHAREEIAEKLTAEGMEVTLDPRGQPPMVLVDAPSLVARSNAGATWEVTIPVRIIHPPPGNTEALAWLLDQLASALSAVPGDDARSTTYSLNDKDHPAYSFDVVSTLLTPCS
jgi:hypothetical protein